MTLRLSDLKPTPGSRKHRKRVGRGVGSGHGKTSTRGHKGQKAHGGNVRPGFEGGQTPLNRRLPKKGFKNINAVRYAVVNIKTLEERFEASEEITPEKLMRMGIIKKLYDGLKVLGDGELTKPLKVKAHAFSKSAKEKIEAAGGTAEVI